METRITATELAKNLSDILNRARYKRERFIIQRNGDAVAVLGPPDVPGPVSLRAIASRLGTIELPDKEYFDELERIQSTQPRLPPPIEWDT